MTVTMKPFTQAFRIVPLDAPLGARVEGCDRSSPWDADTAAAIHGAFLDHEVLVFPGTTMDAAQTSAFARRFGEPIAEINREKRHGAWPEVSLLNSTITEGDVVDDMQFHTQSVIRSDEWHTDQSFVENPALATILHAHEVPSRGGATWFCDTRAAYEALSVDLKKRIDGLKAVHGYDTKRAKYRPVARSQEEVDETPDVIHPLVRTHPETGKKSLYLNFNRLNHIVGMEQVESDALLDHLGEWVSQERFQYRHNWSVGDAVVWDNRCTMHRVSYDSPPGDRRVMLRVVTQGDRPF
ncbi:MAG: TauD/TfdA dioxygenase family protein [Rhodospirillales bacterium]|jgi:taurine dioxygenase